MKLNRNLQHEQSNDVSGHLRLQVSGLAEGDAVLVEQQPAGRALGAAGRGAWGGAHKPSVYGTLQTTHGPFKRTYMVLIGNRKITYREICL